MTRRLAVIPARAGSKRIHRKNVRDFHGRPMIGWAIQAALDSQLFDAVHVSTDSDEIATIAVKEGANVDFPRPGNLADDSAAILPVVKFVADEYARQGREFGTLAMLYATSPMTDPAALRAACADFEKGDQSKPLLAVAPFPCPLEWAFRMKENGALSLVQPGGLSIRSQDLEPAWFDAAMFCFYSRAFLSLTAGAVSDLVFRGFPVAAERVADIDTPDQWARADAMFAALRNRPA